ncbi:hypothetical protein HRW19_13925, partial [Streptomyces lunaelactis]|nr:hypothetical protein [Streptomyces lunaelactis]
MPDYFDRLLARYTPVSATGGAGGAARVRPRLPGPFERVEALRSAPQEPDAPAALIPSAPAFGPAESVRHEREVRTDRHTVLRTEAARPGEPERPAVRAVPRTEPLLRPVAPASPGPRPAAADTSRSARRAGAPPAPDPPPHLPAPPAPAAAPPPPAPAAPAPPPPAAH